MWFSKNYLKLDQNIFTTIRKNTGYYKLGNIYKIKTPSKEFKARLIEHRKMDEKKKKLFQTLDDLMDELIKKENKRRNKGKEIKNEIPKENHRKNLP